MDTFCKKLPKIELHAHLSGSITRECLREIWLQKKQTAEQEGAQFDLEDPFLAIPDGKVDYDLVTFFPLFSNYIYHLCNDVAAVKYSTEAVLRDFDNDGVVYLELRTTPREFKETGLTKTQYVETVLDTIDKHNASSTSMKAYLILSIDMRDTPEQAQKCVDLAIRYQHRGVVGMDLCGDPLKANNLASFTSHFEQAHRNGLKVTLHFAEIAKMSTEENLRLLLSFNPDRLGHVIHVPASICAEITRRKLPLELCVSCNVHAKMLIFAGSEDGGEDVIGTYGDHHFGKWWKDGNCPVILCTDDVGVFLSPLSNEYALVALHFGLSSKQLWELSYRAVDAIFSGEEEKERLRSVLSEWRTGEEGRRLLREAEGN
ncbi:adenosine/AMP deaminase family protein [Kalaharituber pfeilii]|nr:adenosine/AMP deaminase family protein [Kalaharituber pfeilii]